MNSLVDRIADGTATLLGVEDICTRLGVSRTTFDRWVRNGGSKVNIAGNPKIGSAISVMKNPFESTITFPPPDIRIGNSPKWEMETFKNWLTKNAKSD